MKVFYRSQTELPRLSRRDIMTSKGDGIWFDESESERYFYRYGPAFTTNEPRVDGLYNISSSTYRSPPVFCVAAKDVRLIGYRTILFSDNSFCDDELCLSFESVDRKLETLAKAGSFENEDTKLSRGDQPESNLEFDYPQSDVSQTHISGRHVVLASHEPSNYGSFIFRVLPKILTVRELGLEELPVVVWASIEPFLALLELCGINRKNIVLHNTNVMLHLQDAVFPSLRNPHGFLDPASRALFTFLGDSVGRSEAPRKIYVSRMAHARGGGSSRVMMNEHELTDQLVPLGFEIIEPESYSVIDQIKIFASADFVIGPSGSALFNCVFCRPGTKVIDIESEPHWIYAHTGIFASCGLNYAIATGLCDASDTRDVHRRWTADIDSILNLIKVMQHS